MSSNGQMARYLSNRVNLVAVSSQNYPPYLGPVITGHRWALGFEGFYSVSKSGEVASYRMNGGYIMKQRVAKNGYKLVKFQGKNMRVHREVALAWIGIPQHHKCQVHHIDGNRENNNAANLTWVTPSENNQAKYSAFTYKQPLLFNFH